MLTTKDKILEATVSYIKNEANLSQVSISDIARKADIGKSTVYEYFDTKETLIKQTYLYLLDKYEKTLLSHIREVSFKKALMDQLSNILLVMEDAKVIMEVIMNAHSEVSFVQFDQCSRKIRGIQAKMTDRFNEIFMMGIEEQAIKPANKPYTPHIVQAIISGLMFQFVDGKIDISRENLLTLISDELIRVIQAN